MMLMINTSPQGLVLDQLVAEVAGLLKAPPAPRHGYCLYIRLDPAAKQRLFGGHYLTEENLDLLAENFVLELTPAPVGPFNCLLTT